MYCRPWTAPWACATKPRGEKIALAAPVTFAPALADFLPAAVENDEWGRPWARTVAHQWLRGLRRLAGTDGFVELPPGPNTYPKGFVTRLYRW